MCIRQGLQFRDDTLAEFERFCGAMPMTGMQTPDASWAWPIHCFGMVGVAHRQVAFFRIPAGGVDICNVPVPVQPVQPR